MEERCGDAWESGAGLGDNLPGFRDEAYVARIGVDMNLVYPGVEGTGGKRALDLGRVRSSEVDMCPNCCWSRRAAS